MTLPTIDLKTASEAEKPLEPLTPPQIENWRGVMIALIGPYARIMPVADIEKMRQELQRKARGKCQVKE